MTTTATICGLYTRVSGRNQAEADYSSLETQGGAMSIVFKKMADIPPTPWTGLHSRKCFAIFATGR